MELNEDTIVMSSCDPVHISTLIGSDAWVSQPLTSDGEGEVKHVFVTDRCATRAPLSIDVVDVQNAQWYQGPCEYYTHQG